MSGRLALGSLGRLAPEHRPVVDPAALRVGVVHLGLGAFHRAHQLSFLEDAAAASGDLGWAVSAFSQRTPDAARVLGEQDGLYSLRVASAAGSSLRVLASLREARFAGEGGVVERLADPRVRLVTLTVTEKGYRHDPATGRLRRGDPAVAHDAASLAAAGRGGDGAPPPATVLGQLAHGLAARRVADAGPLTVLCCDNLPANGRVVAGLVGELLELAGDVSLAGWVASSVGFPCSMVDRIVPAATARDLGVAEEVLGLADAAPVVTEPFRQWVLEDRFAGPRPAALGSVGVELVDDVARYETLKLRVLNGAHSAFAYLGLLAGCEMIAGAVAQAPLSLFVRAMLDAEVVPRLVPPPGTDLDAYRDGVLERFANPVLAHHCLQVAGDGSQKLPQRILDSVRACLQAGVEPRRGLLVVAAWARAICHARDEAGRPFEVSDPLAPELRALAGTDPAPGALAAAVLSLTAVFGEDLPGDGRVRRLLAGALGDLERGSVAAVAADYGSGAASSVQTDAVRIASI